MLLHQRRFVWLDLVQRGTSVASLARRHGLAVPVVQAAIDDARRQHAAHVEALRLMRGPPLYLFYPLNGLFPASVCEHRDTGDIPDGSCRCCAVCHQSGCDHDHPALERFPLDEPRPEPRPPVVAQAPAAGPLTRRQKRAARITAA